MQATRLSRTVVFTILGAAIYLIILTIIDREAIRIAKIKTPNEFE